MSSIHELSSVCAERNPNPADQRRRLIAYFEAGADIQTSDKNGVTALHHAVRFRNPIAVKTLIEHGADVNQTCRRSGSTPLHRAVICMGAPGTAGKPAEQREIVALLLAAGADPSIRNRRGHTPGDYATDEEIQRLLVAGPRDG